VIQLAPVGYLEMLWLLQQADLVLTDSGGLQKEAFFFGKPCVTMRDETEWTELVEIGANTITGADEQQIIKSIRKNIGRSVSGNNQLYGGGNASSKIVNHLLSKFNLQSCNEI
jgi:UDP-GlcNAc3NAcA epimerase